MFVCVRDCLPACLPACLRVCSVCLKRSPEFESIVPPPNSKQLPSYVTFVLRQNRSWGDQTDNIEIIGSELGA